MTVRSELQEAPEVVERLLDAAWPEVDALARAVRGRSVDMVLIAARGTSDHAAIYAQYALGARNGLPVALAAPSLVSLYGAGPRLRNALVLGVSQSGRSPDIVAVLDDARRQGAITAAITNDPGSELAAAAEHLVDLRAGPELAVAATKTYVAELAAVALLSAALDGDGCAHGELRALPDAIRTTLMTESVVEGLAGARASHDRCAVLGRGFQYATAREWALKLKELAYVFADPYSAADFQHGPIALVEPGFPVLAVATVGPALAGMVELLGRLRSSRADLLVLTDTPEAVDIGATVSLPPVPEWLSPIVSIVAAQLYAYHVARARGLDTEAPRNLTKVTLTR